MYDLEADYPIRRKNMLPICGSNMKWTLMLLFLKMVLLDVVSVEII